MYSRLGSPGEETTGWMIWVPLCMFKGKVKEARRIMRLAFGDSAYLGPLDGSEGGKLVCVEDLMEKLRKDGVAFQARFVS